MRRPGQTGDKAVKSEDIKKHRNDVYRLLGLLPQAELVDIADPIKDDLRRYAALVEGDDRFDPTTFGADFSRQEGLDALNRIYALTS